MRTPHTACRKGTKVFVKLKDGTSFVDRFKDRKGHFVIFDTRKVVRGDIVQFTFYKHVRHLLD